MVNWAGTMGKGKISERLWRFLATVMLFAVGWTMWIYVQLNPPALITAAAFEAAARAGANAKQSAQGVIAPAAASEPPAAPGAVVREPPINAEKLKLSDSLSAREKK
jgi:hypothetical protein